jgi:hypothetical protein
LITDEGIYMSYCENVGLEVGKTIVIVRTAENNVGSLEPEMKSYPLKLRKPGESGEEVVGLLARSVRASWDKADIAVRVEYKTHPEANIS